MRRKIYFFNRWEHPLNFESWTEKERITYCDSRENFVHPTHKFCAWVWTGSYHPSNHKRVRLPSFNMKSVPRILYEACRASLAPTWRGRARLAVVKQAGVPMCLPSDVNPWKYLPGFAGSTKEKDAIQIGLGYESMYKERKTKTVATGTPGNPMVEVSFGQHLQDLAEVERAIRVLFQAKMEDGSTMLDIDTMVGFGFSGAYEMLKNMFSIPRDIAVARKAWDNVLLSEKNNYTIPESSYELFKGEK